MDMKIVGVSVAVLVSLVVLAGVLMPILDDATTVNEKFTNEGIPLSAMNADTAISASWDHTNPNKFTLGDKTLDLTSADANTILLGSENFYCQWFSTSTVTGMQFFVGDTRVDANTNNSLDMTITVASGTVTVTNGSVTKTASVGDHAYVRDSAGDHVMKSSTVNAKVLGDTEITVIRITQISSGYPAGVTASGTIDDGLTYSAFFYNPSAVTFGDSTVTSTAVDGYVNLYDVEKLSVPATQGTSTVTVVTSSFIVPTEITAEKSVHLSDNQNELLAVIPVMIIVAILLGVLAAVIFRRQ